MLEWKWRIGSIAKMPVDMAYMPLFQFMIGELYTGVFHIGTIQQMLALLVGELTLSHRISVRHMESPVVIEFEKHVYYFPINQ